MKKSLYTACLFGLLLLSLGELTGQTDPILISIPNGQGHIDTINILEVINGNEPSIQLLDQDERPIDASFFDNKVVLLDFWYLACAPCIVELPGLELLQKKVASQDFVLLTFAIDTMPEIEATLFKNRRMNLAIVPGVKLVTPRSYPLKALFNKEGQLVDLVTHGSIAEDSIQQLIAKYYPLIRELL